VLVVMMHSVGGLNEALQATGWINNFVAFAKPFRMPDFFLIAGLFLARGIDLPWRRFLDKKVLHFVYFYVIWVTIQLALKQGGLLLSAPGEFIGLYLASFINPLGTLWFIFILPIFFVVTKWARDVKIEPVMLLGGAALLEIGYQSICLVLGIANPGMHIGPHELTGFIVIDEFCQRYVYFAAGYLLAPTIFSFAEKVSARPLITMALLALWGLVNGFLIFTPASALLPIAVDTSLAGLPIISLLLGAFGAMAVVEVSALLARLKGLEILCWIGSRSIVVYLAFFLPMAVTRMLIERFTPWLDVSIASMIVTGLAVAMPLLIHRAVTGTPLMALFERPDFLKLDRDRGLTTA
jgi:uncharacterized membrane protein YcfT